MVGWYWNSFSSDKMWREVVIWRHFSTFSSAFCGISEFEFRSGRRNSAWNYFDISVTDSHVILMLETFEINRKYSYLWWSIIFRTLCDYFWSGISKGTFTRSNARTWKFHDRLESNTLRPTNWHDDKYQNFQSWGSSYVSVVSSFWSDISWRYDRFSMSCIFENYGRTL